MLILAAIAFALWLVICVLPWRPWGCAERLEADKAGDVGVPDVTVLIPARNEAKVVGDTLGALVVTNPEVPVIVIDDQSSDRTAAVAADCGLQHLTIIHGTPPPGGWTGKLWALEQGLARVTTPRVLLLDGDIRLAPGMLPAMARKAGKGYALVSVCAEPCWHGIAARWTLPAFVYFFKLLYPFALANRARSRVAAAAGGAVLVEREALTEVGAFSAWRGAIIDDCTLAARIKRAGYRCWLGLTHGAISQRRATLADIARMIARTAFVQLQESWWVLLAASVLMITAFWIPVLAVGFGSAAARALGALAWLAMMACYLPILRYYRRNPLAAIALPLAATLFLAMTWYSAWRALQGTRSAWKGRRYRRETH